MKKQKNSFVYIVHLAKIDYYVEQATNDIIKNIEALHRVWNNTAFY